MVIAHIGFERHVAEGVGTAPSQQLAPPADDGRSLNRAKQFSVTALDSDRYDRRASQLRESESPALAQEIASNRHVAGMLLHHTESIGEGGADG